MLLKFNGKLKIKKKTSKTTPYYFDSYTKRQKMNLKYFYDLTLFNLRCKFLILIFRYFLNYFENLNLNIYIFEMYPFVSFCIRFLIIFTILEIINIIRCIRFVSVLYPFFKNVYFLYPFLKFIKNKIL